MRNYQNPAADLWYRNLEGDLENFPFSFSYAGETYNGFGNLHQTDVRHAQEGQKQTAELTFALDALKITLLVSHYAAYGASEWTVWFENVSDQNSAQISRLETRITFEGREPRVNGIMGDRGNQYRPYSQDLMAAPLHFFNNSGRPTHVTFPYFDLQYGDGGALLAIGWAGSWMADFCFDGEKTVYTACTPAELNTYLKPGEKIRSALHVCIPYTVRSETYSSNLWRAWFVECSMPRANAQGDPVEPFSTCCIANDTGLPNTDGSISERYTTWKPSMEKQIAEGMKTDFRWFDAGWYVAPDGRSADGSCYENDWFATVGTWELDPVKWPGNTFRESTDYAREHGMKTLVWFEPERVTDPESLAKHYGYNPKWAIRRDDPCRISNNIGDPECLKWTTERICKMLRENRVEMYREDNNINPGELWRHMDAMEGQGREGITESKLIAAHYKLWDDIIECTQSYGGCAFVDSCAGGGGRNDLESLRRGIPLLRSDADRTTTALRLSMSSSFHKWIPMCGSCSREQRTELAEKGLSDVYAWRASYMGVLNVTSQFAQDPDQDFEPLRFGMREFKKVSPYLLKEFYVHTPWHPECDRFGFTAHSYWDAEKERGVLLLFRMEDCEENSLHITLPYAEDGAMYHLTDEDSGETLELDGRTLRTEGCTFKLMEKRSARLLWVEKEMKE